jgi:hypothetical protein
MQRPWQRPERLTAIILHREHGDHMQSRRALRMPSFVAEKSQSRNCQWQERVVFSHRCACGGKAEMSTLASRTIELARRHRKLFKADLFESSDSAAAETISRRARVR